MNLSPSLGTPVGSSPMPASATAHAAPVPPDVVVGVERARAFKIVEMLRENGGVMFSTTLTELTPGWTKGIRTNALAIAKQEGLIEAGGHATRSWIALPGASRTPLEQSTKPVAKRTDTNGKVSSATPASTLLDQAAAGEKVLAALRFSAAVAQDALDAYLLSIANPDVIKPMLKARDNAREALAAYTSQ